MIDDDIFKQIFTKALTTGMPIHSDTKIDELTILMWEAVNKQSSTRPVTATFNLLGSVATMQVLSTTSNINLLNVKVGPEEVAFSLSMPIDNYSSNDRANAGAAAMMIINAAAKYMCNEF